MRDIRDYLISRIIIPRMVLLLAVLLAAAWYCGVPNTLLEGVFEITLAATLLLHFRLWDDLSARRMDKKAHPGRVLCRTDHVKWFICISVFLGILLLATVMQTRGYGGCAFLSVVMLLLAVWYRSNLGQWSVAANYHVVLLKYPAIVLLLAASFNLPFRSELITAAIGIYFLMCVYEVWHDQKLRQRRSLRVVAGVETLILIAFFTMAAAQSY